MGVFKSTRIIPLTVPDLGPVAERVKTYFGLQGYQVDTTESVTGGWHVSITKGGMFKAVVGMQTALNVEIEPTSIGTMVNAGVGIFGRQVVPSLVARLLFWPVLLTQISGMVTQAKLDEEAIACIEETLRAQVGAPGAAAAQPGGTGATSLLFCTSCGTRLSGPVRFCPECGVQVA